MGIVIIKDNDFPYRVDIPYKEHPIMNYWVYIQEFLNSEIGPDNWSVLDILDQDKYPFNDRRDCYSVRVRKEEDAVLIKMKF